MIDRLWRKPYLWLKYDLGFPHLMICVAIATGLLVIWLIRGEAMFAELVYWLTGK